MKCAFILVLTLAITTKNQQGFIEMEGVATHYLLTSNRSNTLIWVISDPDCPSITELIHGIGSYISDSQNLNLIANNHSHAVDYLYVDIYGDFSENKHNQISIDYVWKLWIEVNKKISYKYTTTILFAKAYASILALKIYNSNLFSNQFKSIILLSPMVIPTYQRIFKILFANFKGLVDENNSTMKHYSLMSLSNIFYLNKQAKASIELSTYANSIAENYTSIMNAIPSNPIYNSDSSKFIQNLLNNNNISIACKNRKDDTFYGHAADELKDILKLNKPMLILSASNNNAYPFLGIERLGKLYDIKHSSSSPYIINNIYIGERYFSNALTYIRVNEDAAAYHYSDQILMAIDQWCRGNKNTSNPYN